MAVIDLGSNSWRLVVFTFSPGSWWKRTDELYETVRISAGLAASGRLSAEAMERGLETLAVFERFCAANGLARRDVHAIATSAIRDAANRDQFLADTGSVTVQVTAARGPDGRIKSLAALGETFVRDP